MSIAGPLLGVVIGSFLTWFLTTRARREDRWRDAWAAWAGRAYQLVTIRRQLVENSWALTPEGAPSGTFAGLAAAAINDNVGRDPEIRSALARVLLADPSAIRREQAIAFTDLLAEVLDGADDSARKTLESHHHYLWVLQVTLDHLLGMLAETDAPMQVLKWFKAKYEELGPQEGKSEPGEDVEPGVPANPAGAGR